MKTKIGGLVFLMLFTLFAGAQPKSFNLYNQVRYNNSPKSLMPLLLPIKIASEKQLLNTDNLPDQAAITSFAGTCPAGELVTLDLETWNYYGSALTSTVNNLINSINYFKNANTTSPVSFYAVPPKQAYEWSSIDPVNNPSGYSGWRYINDRLAPVAAKVDNFQPSFYTYDADTTSWRKMVDTTIAAIRRYSTTKPIYAYIWPQYHQGTDPLQLQFIDTAIWKYELRTLYDRANGVIIWTSNKNPDGTFISWDPNMLWWQATKSFMVEKSLTEPFMLDTLTVKRTTGKESLYWSTSIDTTTYKFLVQRSTDDGVSYQIVGDSITPVANPYTQNIYQFDDDNSTKADLYYRLKMVNKDGSVTYSSVVVSDGSSDIKGNWIKPGGNWTYNFKSGTAGTYTNNTGSGTSNGDLNSAFLPSPPSGNSVVWINKGYLGPFNLDPVADTLGMTASNNTNKFMVNGIEGGTQVAKMSFNITLDSSGTPANNMNYIWSIGNSTAGNTIYSTKSTLYKSATAYKSIFTAIRMIYSNTNLRYTLGFRSITGNTTGAQFTTLSGGSLYGGIHYTIDVYCNNSTDYEDYTGPDGATYSVAPASFHLWAINGDAKSHFSLSVADGGGFDIPRSVETVNSEGDQSILDDTPLNAFLFQGGGNGTQMSRAIIDGGMNISYVGGGLPVTFLSSSFKGRYIDKSVLLNWSTSSEQNNAYFEVQRSSDARTFASIGKVAGHLTTTLQQNYSFIDNNPFLGVNYYKLKQVDMDGKIAFNSDIVLVNTPQQQNAFNVYVSGSQLRASAFSTTVSNAELKVFSVSGQQLSTAKIKLNQGFNQFNVDLSSLQTGIYIAVLNRNGQEEVVKFLK